MRCRIDSSQSPSAAGFRRSMAELEVEKQGPAKANAIEHFGEDVHVRDANPADGQTQYLDDWALSSEESHTKSRPGGPDASCGKPFRKRQREEPRLCRNACPFAGPASSGIATGA